MPAHRRTAAAWPDVTTVWRITTERVVSHDRRLMGEEDRQTMDRMTATYLQRIAYRGALAPTPATLHALHAAHLLAVPFENLDIHWGRPIVLDEAALFTKIVAQRRGGFCYELNGLFATLLRHLGFNVTLLSAGVAHKEGGFGPPFDHLALLVDVDGRWLVDVGFGDSFHVPLRLDDAGAHVQERGVYRVTHDSVEGTLLQRGAQGWEAQYRFTLQPRALADFTAMCSYHQTSPVSPFTQGRVCSRATPEGRITLRDRRLIVTVHGEKTERMLGDEEEYRAALHAHFGIERDRRG